MIRINLLPVRAAKKKETAKKQLAIAGVSIVSAVGVMFALYSVTLANIAKTKGQIGEAEKEITELKKKIGEIENIKKLKEDVQKKLDILTQLRKGKAGPVERMLSLSSAVPDRVWITGYSEAGNSVRIDAIALNEDLIADFIRELEKTQDYGGVELVVSEQVEISGTKMKKFSLTCGIETRK